MERRSATKIRAGIPKTKTATAASAAVRQADNLPGKEKKWKAKK